MIHSITYLHFESTKANFYWIVNLIIYRRIPVDQNDDSRRLAARFIRPASFSSGALT